MDNEIICRFGTPRYVLINNGTKWATEFLELCDNEWIEHENTTLVDPQCNDMVECAIKTLKHNLIVMASMCPMQEIAIFIFLESCLNIDVAKGCGGGTLGCL